MNTEIPYYSDSSRISNSALGWYINKGPRFFRDMLDGKEEGLSGSFLDKGTMIHMYILQPEEFWKEYVVLDYEVPKVKQQLDFIMEYSRTECVYPLEDKNKLMLDAYRTAYSNSKKDEVVLKEASELVEKFKDYIEALKLKNDNRKVISFADVTMLKRIKDNLDKHKKAKELLTDVGLSFNEFHINWEWKDLSCKSLLDRVMIDIENKKITIVDLKTTSNLNTFSESVEKYDYYRQLAFYTMAVTWYMEKEKGIDITDFELKLYIIAIQSTGNNVVKVFNMLNQPILEEKGKVITNTLSNIKRHTELKEWDYSLEYYDGDGAERL